MTTEPTNVLLTVQGKQGAGKSALLEHVIGPALRRAGITSQNAHGLRHGEEGLILVIPAGTLNPAVRKTTDLWALMQEVIEGLRANAVTFKAMQNGPKVEANEELADRCDRWLAGTSVRQDAFDRIHAAIDGTREPTVEVSVHDLRRLFGLKDATTASADSPAG